jgi:hypothetical protein
MGLFARKPAAGDDADALATAESDLKRLTDTQRDLIEQLEAARKDARERRDKHRHALVEDPGNAASLGELSLAARTKLEGLEANAVDLDAELGEARIRLAAAQEAKARADAVVALLAAIDEFSAAHTAAMPATTRLIEATRALGKAQKLDHVSAPEIAAEHLAHALDGWPREIEALLAAAERRVAELRQPPQVIRQPDIEPPEPGPIAHGSRYRRQFPVGVRP